MAKDLPLVSFWVGMQSPIQLGRGGVNRAFPAGLKRSGAAQQVRRGRLLRGTDSESHKTDFEPEGL